MEKHLQLSSGKTTATFTFQLDGFLELPLPLQKTVLRNIYQKINRESLTRQTLEEILRTLAKNRAGLKKEFGKGQFIKMIKDLKTQKRLVVIEPKLL
jgi:hypothetical protein